MIDQSASAVSGDQEGLQNLLVRLKAQSLQVDFQVQREMALSLVLQPYLDPLTSQYLAPLSEGEEGLEMGFKDSLELVFASRRIFYLIYKRIDP